MPPRIPSYRQHRTGQARVTLDGKDYYLGKYGTPESREEYKCLINEWLNRIGRFAPATASANPSVPLPRPGSAATTVNEVILAYRQHAEVYYQMNPKEVEKIKLATRPLRARYGRAPVVSFDSIALETIQSDLVAADLARVTVNERIAVLKRMFKWAVRKKLVPPAVFGELATVDGLKPGRSQARETEPVRPVSQELIDAALPHVCRHVAAMIRLQLLTGARPGEICILRGGDLDTSGSVWVYRPSRHKNMHRGHERLIYLGPQAQAILREFLTSDASAYLFSPRRARDERYRELRAKRKSKVQPSQRCRRKALPKKLPGERYTTYSYRQAIRNACRKAGVAMWHPHQLRHTAATRLRRDCGIELARIVLGHATAFTTEIYAEADRELALGIMGRIG
jgi:integrase